MTMYNFENVLIVFLMILIFVLMHIKVPNPTLKLAEKYGVVNKSGKQFTLLYWPAQFEGTNVTNLNMLL